MKYGAERNRQSREENIWLWAFSCILKQGVNKSVMVSASEVADNIFILKWIYKLYEFKQIHIISKLIIIS